MRLRAYILYNMSHNAPCLSAADRQQLRSTYYATSELEAGRTHLWHLQSLAAIQLAPTHRIEDAPDIDFQTPALPDPHLALFADRLRLQMKREERRIARDNKKIFEHLVDATRGGVRLARHMNQIPTRKEEDHYTNIALQTMHRQWNRERQAEQIGQDNTKILSQLVAVKPVVRTAASLDQWYHTVHKTRLQQLSRFRPAERYAGERVLTGTKRRGLSSRSAGARRAKEGDAAGLEERELLDEKKEFFFKAMDAARATCPPFLSGRPYPPLTVAEALKVAPSSLLPAASGTSYGGVSLRSQGGADDAVAEMELMSSSYGKASALPPVLTQPSLLYHRPSWQNVSETDIPLLHYAADMQLRYDGQPPTPRSSSLSSTPSARDGGRRRRQQQQQWNRSTGDRDGNYAAVSKDEDADLYGSASGATPTHSRRVRPEEEGVVTQMWRDALRPRRHGSGSPLSEHHFEGSGGGLLPPPPLSTMVTKPSSPITPAGANPSVASKLKGTSTWPSAPETAGRPPLASTTPSPPLPRHAMSSGVQQRQNLHAPGRRYGPPESQSAAPRSLQLVGWKDARSDAVGESLMDLWLRRKQNSGKCAYIPI